MPAVIINPYQSTFIDSGNPDYNFIADGNQSSDYTVVGANNNSIPTTLPQSFQECIALYSFGEAPVPAGATITSVYINVWEFYVNGDITGYAQTGISLCYTDYWDPANITWNNQPAITPKYTEVNPDNYGNLSFDISSFYYPSTFNIALVRNQDFDSNGYVNISYPSGRGAFLNNNAALVINYTLPSARRRAVIW